MGLAVSKFTGLIVIAAGLRLSVVSIKKTVSNRYRAAAVAPLRWPPAMITRTLSLLTALLPAPCVR